MFRPSREEQFNQQEKTESVELYVTDGNKSGLLAGPTGLLSNNASLIDNWISLKDHNLRNGIPNLEQLLLGKGRPPLDAQNFGEYVEREDSVGTLLLDFYKRVIQFEEHCLHHEHRYSIPPQSPQTLLLLSISFNSHKGRSLVPTSTMSPQEVNELKELSDEARAIIDEFLDPRSSKYIGCPTEFLWRARAGLDSPDVSWNQVLSSSKQNAFNLLNTHFYGSFIKDCFHTNISVTSAQLCLFAGAIILVFAFTLPLSMVFYDLGPRPTRLALLPFAFFGSFFLLASYTRFLPILGLRHLRESSFRKYDPLIDPLVSRAHYHKAFKHLSMALASSTIIAVIFVCLPGNHLMREIHH
ncbi:hypothetical protein DSO57_1027604 [Entomophthora muscae]|uniref:Uncharacterized protein n=1 Tax=Entomophthora muscae TaxID=34485 RepID=A0ACC2RGG2_9FUNG|nr:hypothetical protein DSO57_1027604 [Entomophthora muscae]